MIYICDSKRHLVCYPYSVEALHEMAEDLGIARCWYHGGSRWPHYDIPKQRLNSIRKDPRVRWLKSTADLVRMISGRRKYTIVCWVQSDGCHYALEPWTKIMLEGRHGSVARLESVFLAGSPEDHTVFLGHVVCMLTGVEAYGVGDFVVELRLPRRWRES